MSRSFVALMERMPEIMAWLAVLYYLASVVTTLAAGDELGAATGLGLDTLPVMARMKLVVLIFIQPLVNVVALLFGAALLWRIDRFLGSRPSEASK